MVNSVFVPHVDKEEEEEEEVLVTLFDALNAKGFVFLFANTRAGEGSVCWRGSSSCTLANLMSFECVLFYFFYESII